MELTKLFPKVVGKTNINRNFTEEEKEFFRKTFEEQTHVVNRGNRFSADTYLLQHDELKGLKSDIQKALDEYLEKVIIPKNNVRLEITQSWINWTKYKGWHHPHSHRNSYLSGVFYIEAYEGDRINFEDDTYHQIHIQPKFYTDYNSTAWYITTMPGDIVIFPSGTQHNVEKRMVEQGVRTSLAFNVIPLGELGERGLLTELILG